MKEKVKLQKIKSNTERKIVELLNEKDQCMRGDIFMSLKLSYKRGHKYLNSLLDKDWVSNTEKAPYYTLKIDIE
ncbi:MAG TPA: hypothetical protein VKA27_16925 [Sunxiuqinia sp.]|nr:hypothetical protein [Sunxiuqinia sp.]